MNDSELIDLFRRCGSLGRSNHVGRLDRRGVTRLFFRIQRLYSATSKPRRGEGMRDTAVLLRWPWLWFMWPRHEIRDINLFQSPWLLFWMNLDCGHFAVVWSLSSLPKYTAQNVKQVVIHCHHTCYPSFLRHSSSYKSRTCSWHGDWHKCFLFFRSQAGAGIEIIRTTGQWWESTHLKAWGLPAKEMIPTMLIITNEASWQIVTGDHVSWKKSAEASRGTCDCSHTCSFVVCWYV